MEHIRVAFIQGSQDREQLIAWVRQAYNHGASLYRSCEVIGISVHSWYRWQQDGAVIADQRPLIDRPEPANKLSAEEQQSVLAVLVAQRICLD